MPTWSAITPRAKESLDLAHGLGLPVLVSDARDAEDEAAAKVAVQELAALAVENFANEPDGDGVLPQGAVLTEFVAPDDVAGEATDGTAQPFHSYQPVKLLIPSY